MPRIDGRNERGPRQLAANLLLAVGSALLSLVFVELIFRFLDHNVPLITRYDPHTGFVNASSISGWTTTESVERITLDVHGLRVADNAAISVRPRLKPPGVFRIAVLGDSYTESFYVGFESTFPRVLEQVLQACSPDRRIEVLNFGVSGYSNVQELLAFRHRARHFEPDLVLLVMHPENDLRNNFRKHEQNPFIPYAEFRGGRLVLDETFRSDPAFQRKLRWSNLRNDVVNYAWSLQFVVATLGRWRQSLWHEDRVRALPAAPQPVPIPANTPAATQIRAKFVPSAADLDELFRPETPTPPIYANPEHLPPARLSDEILWRLAEALILALRDEVRGSGATFWLTSTATGVAIAPDDQARLRFVREHGLTDTDYAMHRLADFSETAGIGYIPLAPALREYARATGTDLEWFEQRGGIRGHWIGAAHAVVGRTLGETLCAAGAVR